MEKEKEKTPISLWITVILGTFFVICGFLLKFQGILNGLGQEKIADLLAKNSSVEDEFDDGFDAKKYSFYEDEHYNQIYEINVNGVKVYAFRMETDTPVGNDGGNFNYEIGRIKLNTHQPNKSKCTYNYRASLSKKPVEWFDCSETDFIKSIPKIANMKKEVFLLLKNVIEEENMLDVCGYVDGHDEECDALDYSDKHWKELGKKHKEYLTKLRTTTLKIKKEE